MTNKIKNIVANVKAAQAEPEPVNENLGRFLNDRINDVDAKLGGNRRERQWSDKVRDARITLGIEDSRTAPSKYKTEPTTPNEIIDRSHKDREEEKLYSVARRATQRSIAASENRDIDRASQETGIHPADLEVTYPGMTYNRAPDRSASRVSIIPSVATHHISPAAPPPTPPEPPKPYEAPAHQQAYDNHPGGKMPIWTKSIGDFGKPDEHANLNDIHMPKAAPPAPIVAPEPTEHETMLNTDRVSDHAQRHAEYQAAIAKVRAGTGSAEEVSRLGDKIRKTGEYAVGKISDAATAVAAHIPAFDAPFAPKTSTTPQSKNIGAFISHNVVQPAVGAGQVAKSWVSDKLDPPVEVGTQKPAVGSGPIAHTPVAKVSKNPVVTRAILHDEVRSHLALAKDTIKVNHTADLDDTISGHAFTAASKVLNGIEESGAHTDPRSLEALHHLLSVPAHRASEQNPTRLAYDRNQGPQYGDNHEIAANHHVASEMLARSPHPQMRAIGEDLRAQARVLSPSTFKDTKAKITTAYEIALQHPRIQRILKSEGADTVRRVGKEVGKGIDYAKERMFGEAFEDFGTSKEQWEAGPFGRTDGDDHIRSFVKAATSTSKDHPHGLGIVPNQQKSHLSMGGLKEKYPPLFAANHPDGTLRELDKLHNVVDGPSDESRAAADMVRAAAERHIDYHTRSAFGNFTPGKSGKEVVSSIASPRDVTKLATSMIPMFAKGGQTEVSSRLAKHVGDLHGEHDFHPKVPGAAADSAGFLLHHVAKGLGYLADKVGKPVLDAVGTEAKNLAGDVFGHKVVNTAPRKGRVDAPLGSWLTAPVETAASAAIRGIYPKTVPAPPSKGPKSVLGRHALGFAHDAIAAVGDVATTFDSLPQKVARDQAISKWRSERNLPKPIDVNIPIGDTGHSVVWKNPDRHGPIDRANKLAKVMARRKA